MASIILFCAMAQASIMGRLYLSFIYLTRGRFGEILPKISSLRLKCYNSKHFGHATSYLNEFSGFRYLFARKTIAYIATYFILMLQPTKPIKTNGNFFESMILQNVCMNMECLDCLKWSFFFTLYVVDIICGAFVIICGAFVIICGAFIIICGAFVFICGAFIIICGAFVIICGAFIIICGAFIILCGAFTIICGACVIMCKLRYVQTRYVQTSLCANFVMCKQHFCFN